MDYLGDFGFWGEGGKAVSWVVGWAVVGWLEGGEGDVRGSSILEVGCLVE